MEILEKILESGFKIPLLGIGTWGVGGEWDHDLNNDDAGDIEGIRRAIDSGFRHIDTAEVYSGGYSEALVGKAIKYYNRDKLFIATKISPHHLNSKDVIIAAEKSLKRLDTDYLDLYMIHYPHPDIPIKSTMAAMNSLIHNGLVRYIGISNFDIKQFKEAQHYCKSKIIVNQLQYNLIFRQQEKNGMLRYCQENDVILAAWQPIQLGLLAKPGIKIHDDMCKKYKKTQAQIALNWLISQKNVVAIVKMKNPKHLEENLGAMGWEMDKNDIEELRNNYPGIKNFSETSLEEYPPRSL